MKIKNILIYSMILINILGCSFNTNESNFKESSIFNKNIRSRVSWNQSPSTRPTAPAGYKWVKVEELSDEFNGNTIDSNKWYDYHPFWSGRHPSKFKKGNAYVKDGYLQLKNTSRVNTQPSNPESQVWIDAAAVVSKQKIAQPGWYYETSFLASDTAMSSSFWFRVGKFSEIDVIEHIGHATKSSQIDNSKSYHYESNTHVYGSQSGESRKATYTMSTRGRDEFHTYGFWWKDPNTLIFYHNGNEVHRITPSVAFTEKLHMIFDTEALSSKWVGYPTVTSLKDNTRNTMYVDWVHTYKLIKETSSSSSSNTTINPYQKIEAELYSVQNGIQKETCSEGGQNIGYINNGDWIRFDNVAFGSNNAASIDVRSASATAGGNIEIRLGSRTGNLIGTINVSGTGGWQKWKTFSTNITPTSGSKTVYLVFKGGSGYLYNINWLKFKTSQSSSSSSSTSSISSSSSSSTTSSSSSSSGNYTLITAPYTKDGAGEYYWKTQVVPNYINSWNLDFLEINGIDITNIWKSADDLPAKQNGYYYIHYKGNFSWSHIEIK